MRALLPVAGWGAWVLALAALKLVFGPEHTELVLGFAAAGGALVLGALVLRSRRPPRADRPGAPELLTDGSWATVVAAGGVTLAVVGAEIGAWLLGVGLGVLAFGLAGLVREHRAERRVRRGLPAAGDDEPPLRAPPPAPSRPGPGEVLARRPRP